MRLGPPVAALLVLAALLAACGFDAPEPPDHGLRIEALASSPSGEPVAPYGDVRPGRWTVQAEKRWRRAVGTGEQTGEARVVLDLETLPLKAGWQTRVEVRVLAAEGIAERYVRAFDGLRFRYGYDAEGRPDPATIRFDEVAPKGARSFLRGFWPAGLFGATPWFPAHALRRGEAWTREDLGEVSLPDDVAGAEDARILAEGGGRLESIGAGEDGPVLDVRLETLLTVDGERRGLGGVEPLRLGIRDRGRGTFRARDGMPLAWSLTEDIVVGETAEGRTQRTELTLTVEGRTKEVTRDDR